MSSTDVIPFKVLTFDFEDLIRVSDDEPTAPALTAENEQQQVEENPDSTGYCSHFLSGNTMDALLPTFRYPSTSNLQSTSELPSTPDSLSTPESPSTSELSSTPDSLSTPESPSTSELPSTPDSLSTPELPSIFDFLLSPELSLTPDSLSTPEVRLIFDSLPTSESPSTPDSSPTLELPSTPESPPTSELPPTPESPSTVGAAPTSEHQEVANPPANTENTSANFVTTTTMNFHCQHCPKKFTTYVEYRLHNIRHIRKRLTCPHCSYEKYPLFLISEKRLRRHLQYFHGLERTRKIAIETPDTLHPWLY